jgi:hypothetical protein
MTIKRRDAALARISAGVDQPPGAPDVREKIERILTDFRLSHSCVEGAEDESCRLLDALTPPGQTIAVGREEIELLADHLVYELFGPDVVGTTEASVCLAPGRAGRLEGSEAPESRNTQHPLPQATPDGGNRHATLVTHGDPIAAGVNPDQPDVARAHPIAKDGISPDWLERSTDQQPTPQPSVAEFDPQQTVLTDDECDHIADFMERREWTGIGKDDVRLWAKAFDELPYLRAPDQQSAADDVQYCECVTPVPREPAGSSLKWCYICGFDIRTDKPSAQRQD